MRTAFLPGAGLGTRLRPLTDALPKPLIPVFNKPLVEFHLDHLIETGIERFLINTHHCPERWQQAFGGDGFEAEYRGYPIHFRHEPVLLETGGGLKNIEDLAGGEDLLLCNADTLHDLEIKRLVDAHHKNNNAITLGLRASGGPLHVQWDPCGGCVEDIRQSLGTSTAPSFLFTGIYMVSPEVFSWIAPGKITSVIPVFLAMLGAGRKIGGTLLEEGMWMDLGTPASYLQAHAALHRQNYQLSFPLAKSLEPVSQNACVDATCEGFVAIGKDCVCSEGSSLRDSVLWDGAQIPRDAHLESCVVASGGKVAPGNYRDAIL
jgi:mannose-1-phosphate guanylyltransferase